jgi:hypothetical protein
MNMQAKWVVPVWCAIAVCLAGCGHGKTGSTTTPTVNGGGVPGGIAVPFVAVNTTSPALGAASAPAIFTTGSGFVADFATPNAADTGATVTLTTDTSGNLSQISINAPTGGARAPFVMTFRGGSPFTSPITISQLANLVQLYQSQPSGTSNYIYQGTETGLTASSYGAWLLSNGGGNFAFGPLAFGSETTAGQMAALAGSGVATYNGSAFGVGATNGTPFALTSTVQIIANFTTQAVSSTFSNFATSNLSGVGTAPTLPTLSGTGTIGAGANTNQYAFILSGGGYTGAVSGTFYSPTAQETAGVLQATNGAGTSFAASYGAHK